MFWILFKNYSTKKASNKQNAKTNFAQIFLVKVNHETAGGWKEEKEIWHQLQK